MRIYNQPARKQWSKLCKRPELNRVDLVSTVEEVYQNVIAQGDEALRAYTLKFDKINTKNIALSQKYLEQSAVQATSKVCAAIDQATANITLFHKAQMVKTRVVETMPGVICWQESRPIERVGIYIPGGSAPLVSTVLMLGIPAQMAGCKEIIMCIPPNKNGKADPSICYAAQKIGVTKLIMAGGAQAIAAMAVGTKTVPRVDKIFGPGNQYVTLAKQYAQYYGTAIDMPAGPSEVMVIADSSAKADFVAADLLSQAEHGPDSQVVLLTDSATFTEDVKKAVNNQLISLPRSEIAKKVLANSFSVIFKSADEAVDFANFYAPEHLILSVRQPRQRANRIINAGSIFLGNYSPESAGDYATGTNHVLPTNSWAKSYGGVSLDSFAKKVTFQKLTKSGLRALAPSVITLANAEGLDAHAWAVYIRLVQNNI